MTVGKAVATVLLIFAVTPAAAQALAGDDGQQRRSADEQPSDLLAQFPNDAMLSFTACRKAISEWALPYSPVIVEATMTGPVRWLLTGDRVTKLFVRIVYDRQDGRETRKDFVECTVSRTGVVTITPSSPTS